MTMTIPVLTPLPAGYLVQLSDMTAMTNACTFLLTKPVSRVHMATAGQALTASTSVAINFDTVDFDPDGMWSSGTPSRLTIQTPGFYKGRCMVAQNFITGFSLMELTTGPGNPAGAGLSSNWYAGYVVGRNPGAATLGASGVIGAYLYAGDYVQLTFQGNVASSVTTNPEGPFLSLEWVSA